MEGESSTTTGSSVRWAIQVRAENEIRRRGAVAKIQPFHQQDGFAFVQSLWERNSCMQQARSASMASGASLVRTYLCDQAEDKGRLVL